MSTQAPITSANMPKVIHPEYEFHPYADFFPLIKGDKEKEFRKSISDNGQQEPVVLIEHEGKMVVLDGRNRYLACRKLDITCVTRMFGSLPTDGPSPLLFVKSRNFDRRDMTDDDRAKAAAKAAKYKQGQKADGSAMTQADAAIFFGVTLSSVQIAAKVSKDAIHEIQVMEEEKTITSTTAAAIARLPKEEQKRLVEEGPVAIKKAAEKILQPTKHADVAAVKAAAEKKELAAKEKAKKQKQADDKAEADKLLPEIGDLISQGKHMEAISKAKEAMKISPGHSAALKLKDKAEAAIEKLANQARKDADAAAKAKIKADADAAKENARQEKEKAEKAEADAQMKLVASPAAVASIVPQKPATGGLANESKAHSASTNADLILRSTVYHLVNDVMRAEFKMTAAATDGRMSPDLACDRMLTGLKNIAAV